MFQKTRIETTLQRLPSHEQMSLSNTLRPLEVLFCTQRRLRHAAIRIVNRLNATSRIKTLLVQQQSPRGNERIERLWKQSAHVAVRYQIKRRDTDWVFENFWHNPREPKHSKLLGFFLDPQEHHGAGPFLLEKFLSILEASAEATNYRNLKAQPRFLCEGCVVHPESGGYIDLRIERECDDGRFAIIIENKVNQAPDQYGYRKSVGREASQLETCVERMRARFADHEIFVFYLPLTGDRHAKQDDVNAITQGGNGVTFARITFKEHIQGWLTEVFEDWPDDLNQDLRDHVGYYRRLITHLITKNKTVEMDSEILKSIQQEEQDQGPLSLSAFDAAIESAHSLRRVFERVLRGRLLRRIHAELSKRGSRAVFYIVEWPRIINAEPESDYSDDFEKQIIVAVHVSDAIAVGIGWDENGFFSAYLRIDDEQGQFDEIVQREARALHKDEIFFQKPGEPYYAFKYNPKITAERCEDEKAAVVLAEEIRGMQKRLRSVIDAA
ncbi:MAG: hypothetical protein EOP84_02555 [Verrucomicrobiaceae bacterium]|nr:MAG: hypothetical protein EOP84_02555 [Verrucomicrobiaceae bacterium]